MVGSVWRGPWGPGCPCGRAGCTEGPRRVELDDDAGGPWDEPWEDDDGDAGDDDGGAGGGCRGGTDSDEPTLSAQAALAAAADALAQGSPEGAERLVATAPEADVDALVRARVLAALDRLWGLGWEPADVLRWARRRSGPDLTSLVALALGASLAARPAVDVPQRWSQQAAAGGVRAREGSTGFLREASADQRSPGWSRYGWTPLWAQVAADALALALGLERQVAMPSVEAAAGAGGAPRPAAPAAGVDPRLLEKVRLLLAKAESTSFPAEAETFTAAAQSLISRHSLEAALAAGDPGTGGGGAPDGVRIGVDTPYEGQKAALLAAVARANRCSAVWMRQLGCSTVVGFAADLAAVEVLFASLLTQAVRGMTAAGADARPGSHTRRPEFRRAYLESFARRIGQRLEEAASASARSAAEDGGDDGGRLLPVLAARAEAVDDAVSRAFPDLVSRRGPRSLDGAGWASGWAAAELASLDAGQAVTGVRALPSAG